MTRAESISLAVCQEIFPLLICLSSTGEILYQSRRMSDFVAADFSGQTFLDAFELDAPHGNFPDSSEFLKQHAKSLILFHTRDQRSALRGQLIPGWYEGSATYFLLCTPWLIWMRENFPKHQFDPLDFPLLDSQLDMEMSINMQRIMHQDLEELTESLHAAKVEAEASSRAKSDFVSHISHELRTPLNAINSATLLLNKRRQERDPEEQRLMEILTLSTNTLMELINNVLDFSDLQRAEEEVRLNQFRPRKLLQEVKSIFSSMGEERLCELRFSVKDTVPEVAETDALGLKKVLINLIGNALKHANSELIVVTLTMTRINDGDALQCSIRDFGVGMDDETQARLFEEFYTGQGNSVGSSGLGMSITRKLIERLGGTISVESALNEGTCFKVIYPVTVVSSIASDLATSDDATRTDTRSLRGHVLLVDDNAINLEVGSMLLQSLGLTVAVADSGKQAISCCRNEHFDLVFMDINMPRMNGMEACRQIHSLANCRDLPVFALTANVSRDDEEHYRAAGMQEVLLKPLQMDVLAETAARYLQGTDVCVQANAVQAHPGQQNTHCLVLNQSTLESMLEGVGAESARNLLEIFETAASEIVHALVNALSQGNLAASRNLAHKLASSCLTYGLERMGQLLQEIEQSNDATLRDRAQQLAESLEREHEQSLAALDEIFDSQLEILAADNQAFSA